MLIFSISKQGYNVANEGARNSHSAVRLPTFSWRDFRTDWASGAYRRTVHALRKAEHGADSGCRENIKMTWLWTYRSQRKHEHYVTADKPFLQKQRSILRLLYGILQPTLFKDQVEEGMNYNPKENIDKYTVRTAGLSVDMLLCVFSTTHRSIAG
jgi:hypothetical protein